MMKSLFLIIFFFSVFGTIASYAQVGSLDPEFGGGDGLVSTTVYADQRAEGNAIAVQQDGKLLVAGYTKAPDGIEYGVLLRYLPDGSLDDSFNGSGKIVIPFSGKDEYAEAVKIQGDGKILLLATIDDTAETKLALYRFLADGSPDSTFNSDGVVIKSLGAKYLGANALTLQPDGKILAGGYVGYAGDVFDRFFIVRYSPDGTPDNSFDGDGIVITTVGESYTDIKSLLIQPDGKIIAAGKAMFNGSDDYAVVRYNINGTLDHSFSGDGIASVSLSDDEDRVLGAALQPDGKIVLGGYSVNVINNFAEFSAARLNPDGTLDNSFHGNGKVIIPITGKADAASDLILQPDGKIVLGGYAHSAIMGGFDMAIVRLTANGIPDFDFDGDGIKIYEDNLQTENEIEALALQPDGKIVAAGVTRVNGLNAIKVARFISGLTTSTKEDGLPIPAVSLYPNPVRERFVVKYDLDKTENITINLCDVQGRVIQQLLSTTKRNPGNHIEELTIRHGLPTGNYFVNIHFGDGAKSMMVILE